MVWGNVSHRLDHVDWLPVTIPLTRHQIVLYIKKHAYAYGFASFTSDAHEPTCKAWHLFTNYSLVIHDLQQANWRSSNDGNFERLFFLMTRLKRTIKICCLLVSSYSVRVDQKLDLEKTFLIKLYNFTSPPTCNNSQQNQHLGDY